jgi:hypothetical protein
MGWINSLVVIRQSTVTRRASPYAENKSISSQRQAFIWKLHNSKGSFKLDYSSNESTKSNIVVQWKLAGKEICSPVILGKDLTFEE